MNFQRAGGRSLKIDLGAIIGLYCPSTHAQSKVILKKVSALKGSRPNKGEADNEALVLITSMHVASSNSSSSSLTKKNSL